MNLTDAQALVNLFARPGYQRLKAYVLEREATYAQQLLKIPLTDPTAPGVQVKAQFVSQLLKEMEETANEEVLRNAAAFRDD